MSFKQSLTSRMSFVSISTLLSRIFGLIRDVLFAQMWGTSSAIASFIIAFTIPNLFRGILGEGALSSAFIPIFSKTLKNNGRKSAILFASNVISLLSFILSSIILIIMLTLFILGYYVKSTFILLTLKLTFLMIPFALFICILAILSAILNVFKQFALPALMPVVLNLILILATLSLAPVLSRNGFNGIYSLAIAVLSAGLIQIVLLYYALKKKGFIFTPNFSLISPEIKRLIQLLIPVILGTGLYQINIFVDRILSGYLGGEATSSLYYSQRLVYLPTGLFGVALGVVCLPAMSAAIVNKKMKEFAHSIIFSLNMICYLSIPLTCFFAIFSEDIIKILFMRGSFDVKSLHATTLALTFYLPGIPFFTANKVLLPAFYSREDTKTPLKISAFCLLINIILNIILMPYLKQGGLALATSISALLNFSILLYYLKRDVKFLEFRRFIETLIRISISIIPAIFFVVFSWTILKESIYTNSQIKYIITLSSLFLAGHLIYFISTLLLGCEEPRLLLRLKNKRK